MYECQSIVEGLQKQNHEPISIKQMCIIQIHIKCVGIERKRCWKIKEKYAIDADNILLWRKFEGDEKSGWHTWAPVRGCNWCSATIRCRCSRFIWKFAYCHSRGTLFFFFFFHSMYSNLFNLHFCCTCSLKSHYIRGLLEVAYKNEIKESAQFLSCNTSCFAPIACLGCSWFCVTVVYLEIHQGRLAPAFIRPRLEMRCEDHTRGMDVLFI